MLQFYKNEEKKYTIRKKKISRNKVVDFLVGTLRKKKKQ